jgi:hypothetical protein
MLQSADWALQVAEVRLGRSGTTGDEAALLAQARFRIQSARRLAAKTAYRPALAHVEQGMALLDELDVEWDIRHRRFADPELLRRWRRDVVGTVEASRHAAGPAVVIDKLRRRLVLYRAGRPVAGWDVELGGGGVGRKLYAGDRNTPEGRYRVVAKKSGAATRYHLALLLDYPNAEDLSRHRQGVLSGEVPRGVGPGSLIEIHGGGGRGRDWTDGCVALENDDMETLFRLVEVGTPVTVVGTR